MNNRVLKSEHSTEFVRPFAYLPGCYKPGERLTMENGEIWFHPYDGSPPVKEKDSSQ